MIKIKVDIPNLKDIVEAEAKRLAREITFGTAITMRQKHASAKGTGRRSPRGKGKFHTASRPGEVPVPDTRKLLLSIGAEMQVNAWQGEIRLEDYGWYLEKTRPWIIPSLDQVLAEIKTRQK
ncbi:MAG TPA: hypothetical protein PKY82_02020 [Pyrinomonadaceae bacterium]|nr:hypothetical protein [Pyrinomonadaceae bacterium]